MRVVAAFLVVIFLPCWSVSYSSDSVDDLCFRASSGDLDRIIGLIGRGVDPNKRSSYGDLALNKAAEAGHLKVVEFLLRNGSQINTRGSQGETALMAAAAAGQVEIVKLLLKNKADWTLRNSYGLTAQALAESSDKYVTSRILQAYATDELMTLLLIKAAGNGNFREVKRILKTGVDINKPSPDGMTVLMMAAASGNVQMVQYLLEKGADINATSDDGYTALYGAIKNRRTSVVKMLLQHGPSSGFFATDKALKIVDLAEAMGDPDIATLIRTFKDRKDLDHSLCEQYCAILGDLRRFRQMPYGSIPENQLQLARDTLASSRQIRREYYDKVEKNSIKFALSMYGCDFLTGEDDTTSSSNSLTVTPEIISAVEVADQARIKRVVESGASVDFRTGMGETLLHLLVNIPFCYPEIGRKADVLGTARYLLDHGADINVSDLAGWTPLMCACWGGDLALVRLLLDRGAPKTAADSLGITAADIAQRLNETAIVKLVK
jgi:ankyrin repeat protein